MKDLLIQANGNNERVINKIINNTINCVDKTFNNEK